MGQEPTTASAWKWGQHRKRREEQRRERWWGEVAQGPVRLRGQTLHQTEGSAAFVATAAEAPRPTAAAARRATAADAAPASPTTARATTAGDMGGYSSMEEWAAKDPDGCNKYLSENIKGYQWGKVK